MIRYRRRLPHWDVIGARLFVTFRLHGSLPISRVFRPERLTTGQAFVAMDKILDRAENGPVYLHRAEIAKLVMQAIRDGETRFRRYDLHSFVIMPNHVRLLITSQLAAQEWLRPLKGFTGHEANRILGRSGLPFWQSESFDRLVRDDEECANIKHYIEWNPVKAGLARSPEEYPWSSAPGGSPDQKRSQMVNLSLDNLTNATA
jgi:putative transposase